MKPSDSLFLNCTLIFFCRRITPANLNTCLSSAAYMCFYVKRQLDYKPNTTPSYVLTRENEVLREKEMEKEKGEWIENTVEEEDSPARWTKERCDWGYRRSLSSTATKGAPE